MSSTKDQTHAKKKTGVNTVAESKSETKANNSVLKCVDANDPNVGFYEPTSLELIEPLYLNRYFSGTKGIQTVTKQP